MRRLLLGLCAFSVCVDAGAAAGQPEPMPDAADAPPALRASVDGCRRGVAADCTTVGDHYFSNATGDRGRRLYARAADLEWEAARPVAPGSGRRVTTPAKAIAKFLAAWARVAAGCPPDMRVWARAQTPRLRRAVIGAEHEQLSAERVPYRDAFRWVHELLHEHGGALRNAVLFGAPADLRREGTVWAVTFHGGMEGELIAYVSADDGRVLAVTSIPEG